MKPPDGWKQMTLGEILPEEAVEPVTKALNDVKERRIPFGRTAAGHFKDVLEPYRLQLEEKGVLVDYLAFYLEWMVVSGKV